MLASCERQLVDGKFRFLRMIVDGLGRKIVSLGLPLLVVTGQNVRCGDDGPKEIIKLPSKDENIAHHENKRADSTHEDGNGISVFFRSVPRQFVKPPPHSDKQ